MIKFKYILFFIFSFSLITKTVVSQTIDKRIYEKSFYKALDYIYEEKYDHALNILYALDTISAPQFLKNSEEYQFYIDSQFINLEQVYVKYLIAVCHLEKSGNPQTALPYIEYVLESGYSNTPTIIYKDLGRLYHLDYQFDKALYYFNKYLNNVNSKDEFYFYAKHMVNVCLDAQKLIKDTVYTEIKGLRGNINTNQFSEKKLVTNAEGNIIYFERDSNTQQKNYIWVSYKKADIWTYSKPLQFPKSFTENAKRIKIAGMDFGQNNLLVYKETNNSAEIFICKTIDDKVIEIQPTHFDFISINDGSICYGKNEKEIYFSSARLNGEGGYDIYKVSQKMNGLWNPPENLKSINSGLDEVDPFYDRLHSTLYFSSSSYNTMGGFDIFSTDINKNGPGNPQNIGFAINTVGDNRSFYIPLTQSIAYYSCNQKNNIKKQDLLSVKLNKSIPLTLLNGIFVAGSPPKPVDLKLSVIDIKTNEKLKYSFTSKSQKGKYYIVLQPGKTYDLIFEAEGYKAQRVTIFVPKQEYFYQIFQSIRLVPLDKQNKADANELIVKNDFYDLESLANDSLKQYKDDMSSLFNGVVNKIDSIDEYLDENLKENPSEQTNINNNNFDDLLNLIESTIINQDTATINQLFENSSKSEIYSISYNSSLTEQRSFIVIQGDTLETSPPLKAYSDLSSERISRLIGSNQMKVPIFQDSILNHSSIVFQYEMVFKKDEYTISPKYFPILNDIIQLLNNNPYLQLLIEGISENKTTDKAKELHYTKQKAQIVNNYLFKQNCNCKNVLMHTSLQPSTLTKNYEQDYYFVLIKIYDLTK